MTMLLINTFDVEPWWATVPPCVPLSSWEQLPDRSERPLYDYLDICDAASVTCTFFFVAWYAQKFPQRVAEVVRRGHEIGCHSLQHEDVQKFSVQRFEEDTRQAKAILEDVSGTPVVAYRAPSFSFPVDRCGEFFRVLAGLGFVIDSSISTARRLHGGGFSKTQFDGPVHLQKDFGVDILEIPVPGVSVGKRDIQFFGGGYLRLSPSLLLDRLARRETYQVLYLHPHDLDSDLPPLPNAGRVSNWRRRARIGNTYSKVLHLLRSNNVQSCGQLHARRLAQPAAATALAA